MQKLFSLILLASYTLTANAQESASADSLSNAVSYPELTIPEGDLGAIVQSYKFEESKVNLEKWITTLKRKRKDYSVQEKQLAMCERGIQGLKGTDKVVVIDSVVVDKESFLSAYPTLSNLGSVTVSDAGKKATYTTEMGNKMYEPVNILNDEGEQSMTFKCYMIENGQKVSSSILDGLEVDGELNYPFLMSDGVTFYFAARSEDGFGNYDLYVTRYDSEEDKFYTANNMGYPFNSYANDYMLVVDEENGLGWFASDRFQPQNKVCVYTFLYSSSRNPYDYESDDHAQIVAAASLRNIRSTWTEDTDQDRIKARQRLALSIADKSKKKTGEFEFIIIENFTYEKLSDFHNANAKAKFVEWQKLSKELTSNQKALNKLRDDYAVANHQGKAKLTSTILNLEQKVEKQIQDCHNLEKEVRKLENQ